MVQIKQKRETGVENLPPRSFWCGEHRYSPFPENMRLEMLVEMQVEILVGQGSGLFSNEPFEKRSVMTIENFVLHSDDDFESHLLGNGLHSMICSIIFVNRKGGDPSKNG